MSYSFVAHEFFDSAGRISVHDQFHITTVTERCI
jgi:hypothetical protein